jgi:RHS repeat-associated protein
VLVATSVSLAAAQNETHTYQVVYDPAAGEVNVWRNGVWALGWTFEKPVTEGSYIVLRTRANSAAIFDDVVVSDGHGESVIFFHNDHASTSSAHRLGSVSLLSDEEGNLIANSLARYLPFGEWRTEPTTSDPSGSPLTDHGFTGQKHNMDIGLYYYNARFYAPAVGRFISADVIVPDPTNLQQFNRYSYVLNNALRYTDPSGRYCFDPSAGAELMGTCVNEDGSTYSLSAPPRLPLQPPDGLTDRPYGSEALKAMGPGGLQAYQGLRRLQDEGGGWWGNHIDAQEALMLLLNHEFGNLWEVDGAMEATMLVTANRYNAFCSQGPWSADCFNGFWAYIHPITDLGVKEAARNNARENPRYENATFFESLSVAAHDILNGNVQGSRAPFHYGNATRDRHAFLNGQRSAYWMHIYVRDGEPYQVFVILTSQQHTGTLR